MERMCGCGFVLWELKRLHLARRYHHSRNVFIIIIFLMITIDKTGELEVS